MDIISYALSKGNTQKAVTDYLDEHLTNPTNPPIDTSLSIAGAAADSKETGDRIGALKEELSHKISKPSENPNGTNGQLLRANGDGTTMWVDEGLPTDEQTAEAVNAWLDAHPEATTTVKDGSLTYAKLVSGTLGFVTPEMYGYTGNDLVNDTRAFKSAIESGFPLYLDGGKTYLIDAIEVNNIDHVYIDGRGTTIHAVPHETVVELFKFNSCGNITVKNINVYSDQLYDPDVASSNHDVPTGSKSSNVTFVACVSCDSIKVDNIVAKNMYRFFTTWRIKDQNDNDILNNSVEIRNVKSSGWIRSDIYLSYVKDAFVSNYETEPDKLCIKGVHVFYITSSYKSTLKTENVTVHGLKESESYGWITGVYQLAGNAVSSVTGDTTVRMCVYADNSYIENCKVSVVVQDFDGEVVLTNCVLKNNTLEISNMNTIQSIIKFIGCSIYSNEISHALVETIKENYSSTIINILNCVLDVLDTFVVIGMYTPNMKIIGSVLSIYYAFSHKIINGSLCLENNYIFKDRRGDFIEDTVGTGTVIVMGNHIESKGGDPQFKFENGTLVLANNIIKWLDNTPVLCSSNAVQQNNLIL